MIHPIPSGTRDVLPDEMRELRAICDAMRGVFVAEGYGEVATPSLEHESVLARGGAGGLLPAYRVVDDHGAVLALRSDMTVPIARVVATRYASAEPPLRFCYFANAFRSVRPHRGMQREFLQAGVELIGAAAPEGTAEALRVLCAALDATGLQHYRVGLGDASLYPSLLAEAGVPEAAREGILHELSTRDFVGLERRLRELDLGAEERERLLTVPQLRGGPEVLDERAAALRRVLDLLPDQARSRVIFDLGLVRDLSYYTGAVFEVYDPALGQPIGGGGRYDDLLGRFGRSLPAVGFALTVDSLHVALTGEERLG
ncbi:MAG TPA: ATP phosphoribosyltransferase regulatory subunit [Solirubrobacteraceae bacterium]|nr:ATP phosphoribosyltransferase regulatory subunit [Solirubrobacteraceae bacterium]